MGFQIGDRVVHPVHGVGTIKTLSEQQFVKGTSRQYYEVVMAGSTVWVPAEDGVPTLLREVAPRQVLGECRRLLSGEPVPFNDNHHMRQAEIALRMKGGLLPALCQTVRDLRARSWTIPLRPTEEVLLRRASKALADEWAASDDVTSTDALHAIEAELRKGRQLHMSEQVARDSVKTWKIRGL